MLLTDLEALLGITVTGTTHQERYQKLLDAAIAKVNGECGGRFTDTNGETVIPADVQMGVALLVKSMTENQSVQSQSLGDMSKSFFEGATYRAAQKYWKKYRKVGFV